MTLYFHGCLPVFSHAETDYKGFYVIAHIFLLLAFIALARIKSNEDLRYSVAGEGEILLGLKINPRGQAVNVFRLVE